MSDDTTTIQISIENYKQLNGMKNPGDSFDDVIGRVLDEHEMFHERLEHSEHDTVTTDETETPDRIRLHFSWEPRDSYRLSA